MKTAVDIEARQDFVDALNLKNLKIGANIRTNVESLVAIPHRINLAWAS